MELLLLERIEKLGQMGDVVTVKPGYARNFLLPQKKALRATKENRSHFEQQRAQLEAANLERRAEAEKVGKKLDGLFLTLVRQAGESGQLYGSVNARDVANAVIDAGFTIERRQVKLKHPIKMLGIHEITVDLHPEVSVLVNANVTRSEEEAKIQAKTGKAVVSREEEEKTKDEEKVFKAQAEQVFEKPDEEIEKHAEEVKSETEVEVEAKTEAEDAKTEESKSEEQPAKDAKEGGEEKDA
ncbi:MAG TPA: 50S ribosomal protein L9 [Rhodospirillales bacterium]|nr:50S ribosomal protein L9 [Rhodospirillales bacterium]